MPPTGNTKRRIDLRDAILNHPNVSRVQGAYMMKGDFPGDVTSKKIDIDERGPFMMWDSHRPISEFLKQFLCRGMIAV